MKFTRYFMYVECSIKQKKNLFYENLRESKTKKTLISKTLSKKQITLNNEKRHELT